MEAQRRRSENQVRNAEDDADVIQTSIETRQRTIRRLRSFAQKADESQRKNGSETMVSSGVGITGGLMTVSSGIATICTAGAAAPLLVGALAVTGTATSIGGGVMSIYSTVDHTKAEQELKRNIQELLREDDEAVQRLQDVLACIASGDEYYMESVERLLIAREVQLFVLGFNCTATLVGCITAWDILAVALPLVACYSSKSASTIIAGLTQLIPKVAAHLAIEGVEEVADDIAKEAVKSISNGATKEFVKKNAAIAANHAYKEAMKTASKELAEEAAEQAAKVTAKKAAATAADRAAKEAMKTAGKITGGITVGLGGASVVWDGYNLYKGYKQLNASSDLGKELNRIADFFEDELNRFIPEF